jgi:hypothetical protein
MHPDLEDLLSLRDGEPIGVAVVRHVETCSLCTEELQRLRTLRTALQRLPGYEVPERHWLLSGPAERIGPTRRGLRSAPHHWLSGAAATLGACVLATLLWSTHRFASERTSTSATLDRGAAESGMTALIARSNQLEQLLRRLPRPSLEQASTAATIDELQTDIQALDVQLSYAGQSGLNAGEAQSLWQRRVQLLDSLFDVRYAEAASNL